MSRLGAPLVLTLAVLSCRNSDPTRVTPKPAPSAAAGIPAAVLGGELDGKPFSLKSARYTIDRRHGYEKIDISLSSGSVETPCGARKPGDASSVWLRKSGPEPLKQEEVRLEPKQTAAWEAHYQVRDERRWVGNGDASALIVIHDVGPDLKLDGELWACFADAKASCVSGRFTADYCPIRIDQPVRGTEAMERPPGFDGGAIATDNATDSGPPSDAAAILVEPREQLLPTFPCSSCHANRAPQPNQRLLREFHRTRYEEFQHGEDSFWCYQCHSTENIDRLKLANGRLVSFNEAYLLCTSCHGDKLADWRDGIHGLTAGQWNGAKYKRSCTSCHNPHNPRFQALEPEAPPARAERVSH